MKASLPIVIALALLLSACAPAGPTPPAAATLAPLPTSTPAPADTPQVTSAPALISPPPTQFATATPAPAPGVTLEPAAPSVSCNNPFYPVSETARWQYQITFPASNSAPVTYMRTVVNVVGNGFTERLVVDSRTVEIGWTCTNEGLAASEFSDMALIQEPAFDFETLEQSGVTVPRRDRWQLGTIWTNGYLARGTLRIDGNTLTGTGTINIQNQIAAQEQVTVPAGTFDALRVDSMTTIQLTLSGGIPIPAVTVTGSAWFARDVGLAKSTASFRTLSTVNELLSFTP